MSKQRAVICPACGANADGGNYCPMCGAKQQAPKAGWHRIFEGGFRRDFKYTYFVLLFGIATSILSYNVFQYGLGGPSDPIGFANNISVAAEIALFFSFITNGRAFLAVGVALAAASGVIFAIYGNELMMYADTMGILVDYGTTASLCLMLVTYIWEARRLGLNPIVFSKNERHKSQKPN